MRCRIVIAAAAALLVLAACGGRRHDPPDAGPRHDAGATPDAGPGTDAGAERDAAAGTDAGPPLACDCAPEQPVALFHACTPPLEVRCAIQTCTLGGDDCPAGDTCEDCAAAACCECAACLPACVHTVASPGDALPPLLKLRSAFGPADEEGELIVEGAPFYIGALGYSIRAGDSADLPQTAGGPCSMTATAPPEPAGTMLPVWVSQYGFGEPWVLAGFFSWVEGGDTPTCQQPGLPCEAPSATCCETADAPMTCQDGRCRRE